VEAGCGEAPSHPYMQYCAGNRMLAAVDWVKPQVVGVKLRRTCVNQLRQSACVKTASTPASNNVKSASKASNRGSVFYYYFGSCVWRV
jgi:hypothetical protein